MMVQFQKRINELEREINEASQPFQIIILKERLQEVNDLMNFYENEWRPKKEIKDKDGA